MTLRARLKSEIIVEKGKLAFCKREQQLLLKKFKEKFGELYYFFYCCYDQIAEEKPSKGE